MFIGAIIMFWEKCGKILTDDSGSIVNCDYSPCGYYSVFGIKFRYLNKDTMQPQNKCKWYYDVFPAEVKQGKLIWHNGHEICLQVSQNLGKCGYKKVKLGCMQDCVQWDENWENCIKWQQYCGFVAEIEVYNLSGCYDDYNKFKQYYYSKCEDIQSDSYPDIFQNSYGYPTLTWQASNCLNNYWKPYFSKNYLLNYQLIYTRHQQRWWQYIAYGFWVNKTYYYCTCDDGTSYDLDNGDQDCGQTCHKESYQMEDHQSGIGGYCWRQGLNSEWEKYDELSIVTGGYYGYSDKCWSRDYPCYVEDCCDYVSSFNTTGVTGSHIMTNATIKDKYWNKGEEYTTCQNSNNVCTNFYYEAKCHDNYYWSATNARFHFGWSKVTLQKTDFTPENAIGIKFILTLTRTKKNTGKGNEAEEITSTQQEVDLFFDEVYEELPLLNHVNTLNVISHDITCNDDCSYNESGSIYTEPAINWGNHVQNVLSDRMDVEFYAVDYIRR